MFINGSIQSTSENPVLQTTIPSVTQSTSSVPFVFLLKQYITFLHFTNLLQIVLILLFLFEVILKKVLFLEPTHTKLVTGRCFLTKERHMLILRHVLVLNSKILCFFGLQSGVCDVILFF